MVQHETLSLESQAKQAFNDLVAVPATRQLERQLPEMSEEVFSLIDYHLDEHNPQAMARVAPHNVARETGLRVAHVIGRYAGQAAFEIVHKPGSDIADQLFEHRKHVWWDEDGFDFPARRGQMVPYIVEKMYRNSTLGWGRIQFFIKGAAEHARDRLLPMYLEGRTAERVIASSGLAIWASSLHDRQEDRLVKLVEDRSPEAQVANDGSVRDVMDGAVSMRPWALLARGNPGREIFTFNHRGLVNYAASVGLELSPPPPTVTLECPIKTEGQMEWFWQLGVTVLQRLSPELFEPLPHAKAH